MIIAGASGAGQTNIAYYNPGSAGTYSDTWTAGSSSNWTSSLVSFSATPPATANPFTSTLLAASEYPFSIPDGLGVTGIGVTIYGHQTGTDGSYLTLTMRNPTNPSPTLDFNLPAIDGPVTVGSVSETWGQALTAAFINGGSLAFQIQAISPNPSVGLNFYIYDVAVTVYLTPYPPQNFNYVKTYEQNNGGVLTLALDAASFLWQEDVINNPGVLSSIDLDILPNTFGDSVTAYGREFFAFGDQNWGTDTPVNYDGTDIVRTSQDGPGAPISAVANGSGFTIAPSATGLVQSPAVSAQNYLWSAGSSSKTAGNVLTLFSSVVDDPTFTTPYPGDPDDYRNLHVGDTVYLSGFDSVDGTVINGTYAITFVGTVGAHWGTSPNLYSIFQVNMPVSKSTRKYNNSQPDGMYQKTNTLGTTTSPIVGLIDGGSATIAGAGVAGYDGTWDVLSIPNSSNFDITNTSLTLDVATYSYTVDLLTNPLSTDPIIGQLVTVSGCNNGGVVLDVAAQPITGVTISSPGTGTFTVAVTSTDLSSQPETGKAYTSQSSFVFDPGAQFIGTATDPILGNSGGGTVTVAGQIAEGARGVVCLFLTDDGYLTAASEPFFFSTGASTSTITVTQVPVGPSNIVARWIAMTGAGGANYFVLPTPPTPSQTSTVINDNTSTQATFNFSDAALLAGFAIDIQGNDRFAIVKLSPSLGCFFYASRMFYWGELAKIQNFLNMGFDGGSPGVIETPSIGSISQGQTTTTLTAVINDNSIPVVCVSGTDLGTVTITDSQGNTYETAESYGATSAFAAYMFYALNVAATNALQIEVSWVNGSNTPDMLVQVVENVFAIDTAVVANGTGTAVAAGALTTASPKEIIIGFAAGGAALTATTGSEIQNIDSHKASSTQQYESEIGTFNSEWTQGASDAWIAISAAFQSPSSVPNGWTANYGTAAVTYYPAGAISTDAKTGWSYLMVSAGSGASAQGYISGMSQQSAFQDAYGVAIVQPNTKYGVRLQMKSTGGTGTINVELYSASSPVPSLALASFSIPNTGGIFLKYILSMNNKLPAVIPSDAVLRVYMVSSSNGLQVKVDELEIFDLANPYNGTQLRVSYANDPESFDGVTGVVGCASQNSQNIKSLFELYDDLYIVKSSSMLATQDNGITEPNEWDVREVSNIVGTPSVHGVCYGEEWALIVNTNGLYGFSGGEPVKISQEIQPIFDLIPVGAASSMWIANDISRKEVYIGVPLPTPNQWLPNAPSNPNPTSPNVLLVMNYRELNTIGALISQAAIRQSLMGTLRSWDLARKWTIWQIPSPYGNFVTRPDNSQQMFFGNGVSNSKIYELGPVDQPSTGQDDGVPINSTYCTYGFIKSEAGAPNPQLGSHRYVFDYATLHMTGAGYLNPTAIPEDVNSPYIDALPQLPLYNPNLGGDMQLPLNETAFRLFLQFSTNAIGNWFSLSRVIMSLRMEPWAPIPGGGVIGTS